MLSLTDIAFWQAVLTPICLLTLPITIVSGASIPRSFLTSAVVYTFIVLLAACNISNPF